MLVCEPSTIGSILIPSGPYLKYMYTYGREYSEKEKLSVNIFITSTDFETLAIKVILVIVDNTNLIDELSDRFTL